MSESELVGICVVTWNGGALAVDCIRAALAQSYHESFVVVVDNHSSPSDRAALRACAKGNSHMHVVWNDTNRGFAAAANQAAEVALGRGARWLLLLTQDTVLPAEACQRLLEVAQAIPGLGIAGPTVVDQTTGRVLSVGERVAPWLLGLPRSLVRYRFVRQPYRFVGGVVGCCMLVSGSCWRELGGFREELFAYYEEVDLCLRARKKGYKVALVPSVRVAHRGWRGFAGSFTAVSAVLKSRNLVLVAREHLRPWHWLLVGPAMIALFIGSVLLHAARGQWRVVQQMCYGLWLGLNGYSGPPPELASRPVPCALP